ncbi:hypothetical protein FA15DRAFT_589668, partial [Coprinopsis marcescibilis]
MDTTHKKGHLEKKLKIHWILAHSDVKGNKRVDREAKLAAQGKQNNTATLLHPDILRRPLPISKSKLKQAIKEEAKSTSRAIW